MPGELKNIKGYFKHDNKKHDYSLHTSYIITDNYFGHNDS